MDTYKVKFTILELEIFSYLSSKAGEEFSQRDVAKALKVSPTAVSNATKKLLGKKLIQIKRMKTINLISFNRDDPRAIEMKRVENLKRVYATGLSDYLKENLAGSTIVLFGSYGRGEDIISSDIDIAIIGRKEKSLNMEHYEKLLEKKININYYDKWSSIHKHLKNNILNGIVLHGSVDS